MQVYEKIKLFENDFREKAADLTMHAIATLVTGLREIYKELSFLIKDIIDPDINYDSIEDMLE